MGCNTSTEQVLAGHANGNDALDNLNAALQNPNKPNLLILDKNENQKISKDDNDLQIEDYGADEEEAAVKIQAAFRGHKTRAEMKQQKMEQSDIEKDKVDNNSNNNVIDESLLDDPEELERAATKIQASYRGHRTRAELKQKVEEKPSKKPPAPVELDLNMDDEDLEQQAAVKIQAVFRGHKTRATMKNNSESSNTQTKASDNAATSPAAEAEPTKEELEQEFDPNDAELCHAASKIQATFRGHLARKVQGENGEKLKEEDVDIQELTKKVAEELDIDLSDPDLHVAATKIQASFRGHKVRKQDEKVTQ